MWVKRRFITHRDASVLFVPAKVRDNPGVDADEYVAGYDRLPEDLRRRLLDGDWDAFEGAAFPNFDPSIHVVPAFDLPAPWTRFESMDIGIANPSALLAWASDYDGNLVVFDSVYMPGLVSEQAPVIQARRKLWHLGRQPPCYADPSAWSRTGSKTAWGKPASVITEFQEHDVGGFVRANNDPEAGKLRLNELLEPDPGRPFPIWHPLYGKRGSPRWFVIGERCAELVEQLRGAPANEEPQGSHGVGEIVDKDWESGFGHAVAAARYGAMSWPGASKVPPVVLDDPRAELMRKIEAKRTEPQQMRQQLIDV